MSKRVYKVRELPEVLGISQTKAYQIVHQAGFPATKIGRRILIPADALDRWLLEQAAKGVD